MASLTAEGINAFRIHFPQGQDANDYARSAANAEKSLGLLVRNATWLGNGIAPAPPQSEVERESPPSLVAVVAEAINDESLASPLAPAPSSDTPIEINGEEIIMRCGDRRYRVRGLAKNLSFDSLS